MFYSRNEYTKAHCKTIFFSLSLGSWTDLFLVNHCVQTDWHWFNSLSAARKLFLDQGKRSNYFTNTPPPTRTLQITHCPVSVFARRTSLIFCRASMTTWISSTKTRFLYLRCLMMKKQTNPVSSQGAISRVITHTFTRLSLRSLLLCC